MSSLTVDYVDKVIDRVLQSKDSTTTEQTKKTTKPATTTPKLSASNSLYEWRRVIHSQSDWETIDNAYKVKFGAKLSTWVSPLSNEIPFYFGIQASRKRTRDEEPTELAAVCTFYLAYSTWDGRMLYVDQFLTLESNDRSSQEVVVLYRILAKIAIELQCARLSWKVRYMSFRNCCAKTVIISDNVFAFPPCYIRNKNCHDGLILVIHLNFCWDGSFWK
jgi:hypothetical protein